MNNRYVSQGEYYITKDDKTVLITEGMTECIALLLIDKNNPKNRLLTHLDGLVLESKSTATANIQKLVEKFQSQTDCKEFETYTLGGQKGLQNIENLSHAFKELKIVPTKSVTSKEFCAQFNENSKFSINPTNAQITLICKADGKPQFTSFSSKHFTPPTSLQKLECGEGLISAEEKKQYSEFLKANSNILEYYPEIGKSLRNCNDQELIEKFGKEFKSEKKITGISLSNSQ